MVSLSQIGIRRKDNMNISLGEVIGERYSNSFVNLAGFAEKLPSLTSVLERSDIEKGAWA